MKQYNDQASKREYTKEQYSYKEIRDFLSTPKGRLLEEIIYESEGLSLEGLKRIRRQLTESNLIRLADGLIRSKERTA